MKIFNLTAVSIGLLLIAASANSSSNDCKIEATITEESTVETWNITNTMQIGIIYLQLISNNEIIYEANGTVIGRIKHIDNTGQIPITYLNHKMFFNDGSMLRTKNDVAIARSRMNTKIALRS